MVLALSLSLLTKYVLNSKWIWYVYLCITAGAPGVLSNPFMHNLASPLISPYAGAVTGGLPGLGAFALGQAPPGLRGIGAPNLNLATVLLVSNLNEEVINHSTSLLYILYIYIRTYIPFKTRIVLLQFYNRDQLVNFTEHSSFQIIVILLSIYMYIYKCSWNLPSDFCWFICFWSY